MCTGIGGELMKFSGALIVVGLCLGLPKSAHADATLRQFLDGYKAADLEKRAKLVCGGHWPVDQ